MSDPLVERFARAGQAHVFAHADRLSGTERQRLFAEATEVDLDELATLTRALLRPSGGGMFDSSGLVPAPYRPLPEHGGSRQDWQRAKRTGEDALRAGRVAAFTVAGGQGTRLGFDGPKGTFPVTPVTGKSLFQVFSEKILAAGRRYGRPLHWFIMTSHQNHAATEAFFEEHRHFGLDRGRVHFFRQGRMPAVDFEGRILLEAPGAIALSPDGHGGSLRALARSGALDLMEREGVDTLSYFQVDNPLARCVDPAFIGWHLEEGSEMSSKMVPKAGPGEKVGMFCLRHGNLVVVEYSDLPVDLQNEREAGGRLRFLAGNIAMHALDREFARRIAAGGPAAALPFHRAEKKIPTIDASGAPLTPSTPNGIKFELFVFDALPFARNPLVVETRRADDFSPVKNAEGVDSPTTCRADQLRLFARWLREAGAELPVDATGLAGKTIEVSPLFAYDEDTFGENWSRLAPWPEITEGFYLE